MKYIISERQHNLIKEQDQEVLEIPSIDHFDNDWSLLDEFLKRRGNPPYSIGENVNMFNLKEIKKFPGNLVLVKGNLDLMGSAIESLPDNLFKVEGYFDIFNTDIKSLGRLVSIGKWADLRNSVIKDLGDLEFVGGNLNLADSKITSLKKLKTVGENLILRSSENLESFGDLTMVGEDLDLSHCPIRYLYTESEILRKINVGGFLHL